MQMNPSHVKYNSTSSLYIDSTISKPCIDEIIFCVSIAIHDRIQEGEERKAEAQVCTAALAFLQKSPFARAFAALRPQTSG